MSTTTPSNTSKGRLNTEELGLMWAWVQGCCTSLYGEVQGQERAKQVSMRVGAALWRRQLALAGNAWS